MVNAPAPSRRRGRQVMLVVLKLVLAAIVTLLIGALLSPVSY